MPQNVSQHTPQHAPLARAADVPPLAATDDDVGDDANIDDDDNEEEATVQGRPAAYFSISTLSEESSSFRFRSLSDEQRVHPDPFNPCCDEGRQGMPLAHHGFVVQAARQTEELSSAEEQKLATIDVIRDDIEMTPLPRRPSSAMLPLYTMRTDLSETGTVSPDWADDTAPFVAPLLAGWM
jgi:hypothetical protein